MTRFSSTQSSPEMSMPISGTPIASIPRRERISLRRTADYYNSQFSAATARRKRNAINWVMIRSFLMGLHYFYIDDAGRYIVIPRKRKGHRERIRATVPVLEPWYGQVMGFLSSNPVGVTATPVSTSSESLYRSSRAQDILNGWVEETSFEDVEDDAHQLLLSEGMYGYHWYRDEFRKEVMVKTLPSSELYPIPWNARKFQDLSGLMHATVMTRAWLEMQDELHEARFGTKPNPPMASLATESVASSLLDLPSLGLGAGGDYRDGGAIVKTIWMRPSEQTPHGEYAFMVGDYIYRHAVDKETMKLLYPDGDIPVALCYYKKNYWDFWGVSLCETLLPGQFSINRAKTAHERFAQRNFPMTFASAQHIDIGKLQEDEDAIHTFKNTAMGTSESRPIFHVPASRLGPEVSQSLALDLRLVDQAAGFRSGIVTGQAEGRVESGPATSTLAQNAMATLLPALGRKRKALQRVYTNVLDLIRTVWPDNKTIRISGPNNVGREIKVLRDKIPWSRQVMIHPRPLLAGGVRSLASTLFELKRTPGQDGKPGTLLPDNVFLASLREMGLLPPHIDVVDHPSARIQTRINLLIGDGQRPQALPADLGNPMERQRIEDHTIALRMFRNAILDDSFETYSNPVKQALFQEFDFHRSLSFGGTPPPNAFDDDLERLESEDLARFIEASEADLDTPEGEGVQAGGPFGGIIPG